MQNISQNIVNYPSLLQQILPDFLWLPIISLVNAIKTDMIKRDKTDSLFNQHIEKGTRGIL